MQKLVTSGLLAFLLMGCNGGLLKQDDGLGEGDSGMTGSDGGIVLMDGNTGDTNTAPDTGGSDTGGLDTGGPDTTPPPPTDAGGTDTAAPDTNPPPCTPSCTGRACGDDGCGGSCGVCGPGETCSGAGMCTGGGTGSAMCGTGPRGASPGNIASNLTLMDCDGNAVELDSLCGRRVSYVYTFAEWCPNCRTFVRDQIEREHSRFAAMGELETWIVITAASGGRAVDTATCNRIIAEYGIDTPGVRVLIDPTGQTNSVLGMRTNTADMVMKRGNEIEINGPWAWITVEGGLQRAFAATTP